ncbi:MAG: hypothetical protein QME77_12215 [bacterium]|nr:hypothetical protein [bacterium]
MDLLWRQWTDLGVPGGLEETASWIIDPEALLISTVQFGRYDPRLLDTVLAWCMTNSKWLGISRLQRQRKTLDPEAAQILSGIAGVLGEHDRSGKWTGLFGQAREGRASTTPIPLFLQPDEKPLPMGTRSDPVFLKYGLLRPPWERRNLSLSVSATKPAALRIRLRALFGVTSRAEILLFFLTHSGAHPSLVARQVHYAQPPVAKAMAEMAASGLLTEHRKGREVEYTIDRPEWLRFLHVEGEPVWTNWALIYQALRDIWACTLEIRARAVTQAVLGSELGRCSRTINPLLHESEVGVALRDLVPGRPEEYVEIFAEDATRLFARLGVRLGHRSTPAPHSTPAASSPST